MLRLGLGILALAAAASGAVLPAALGTAQKAPGPAVAPPVPVETELGLQESESASYGPLGVTAWKFRDSTGALGFYFARRATGGAWRQAQNFVLRFDGPKPRKSDLDAFLSALPGQTGDSLPTLPAFLPENGRLAGSERFAVGPAGLAQAEPRLDPALALFDRGSEAAVAAYRDGVTLVVVGFPTPQIARQRLPEFEKVPGAVARRSGPLVALALGPPGPAAAVAASVQYQASVSWNQPTKDYFSTDVAGMLIGIFKLTGYILVFCLSAGLFMLGLRRLGRLLTGNPSAVEPMIVLDLKDK